MKALLPFISGLCVVLYGIGWYQGVQYPGWVPLIWCGSVFFHDLHDYLEHRYNT